MEGLATRIAYHLFALGMVGGAPPLGQACGGPHELAPEASPSVDRRFRCSIEPIPELVAGSIRTYHSAGG
jgi:hypothetical protein